MKEPLQFFKEMGHVKACFSLRRHGNMKGGKPEADSRRKEFAKEHLGQNFKLVFAQVAHGSQIKVVNGNSDGIMRGVDGLITGDNDTALITTGADCFNAFFIDPEIALIGVGHLGWKSLAGGIIENIIEEMSWIGARSWRIKTAVTPGICKNCYIFGTKSAEKYFSDYKDCVILDNMPAGKCRLDLKKIIRKKLLSSGVKMERIYFSPHCTKCHSDIFFSARALAEEIGRKPKKGEIQAALAVIGKSKNFWSVKSGQ